jgi:hypothetical protein
MACEWESSGEVGASASGEDTVCAGLSSANTVSVLLKKTPTDRQESTTAVMYLRLECLVKKLINPPFSFKSSTSLGIYCFSKLPLGARSDMKRF